jgi:CMP-N,N'-diacetyllegionaminic acid synthase
VIYDNKVLAIIPARGGSKGVARKNIREVGGKPLIAWTIEAANNSKYISKTIVSSDDSEIIAISKEWGCEVPFVRPKEISQDDTPGISPVLHAIKELPGFDYIMLLQPTSPLRTACDIDECIEFCFNQKAICCVSVCESNKSPYWAYKLDSKNKLIPLLDNDVITRRQDLPKVFALNGALYFCKVSWFMEIESFLTENTIAFHMPYERSLDIDTEFDLKIADLLLGSGS